MVKYDYALTDFPNDTADEARLTNEIQESTISVTVLNVFAEDQHYIGDQCYIFFDSVLSGAEQTTLDNLVAAHTGVGYNQISSAFAESDPESNTSSTSYQQKVTLTLSDIDGGTFLILWSASVKSSHVNADIKTRVQRNDTETVSDLRWTPPVNGFGPLSGFVELTLGDGDHTFDFDYCSSTSSKSVTIRKARLIVIRN